jgi:hypothetical protein
LLPQHTAAVDPFTFEQLLGCILYSDARIGLLRSPVHHDDRQLTPHGLVSTAIYEREKRVLILQKSLCINTHALRTVDVYVSVKTCMQTVGRTTVVPESGDNQRARSPGCRLSGDCRPRSLPSHWLGQVPTQLTLTHILEFCGPLAGTLDEFGNYRRAFYCVYAGCTSPVVDIEWRCP